MKWVRVSKRNSRFHCEGDETKGEENVWAFRWARKITNETPLEKKKGRGVLSGGLRVGKTACTA